MYRLRHLTKLLSDAKIAGRSAAKTYQQKYELCKSHKLLQEPDELPTDVMRLIVQKSIGNCDTDPSDAYNVLVSLSRVNKEVRSLVEPKWKDAMNSIDTAEKRRAMEQVRKGAINIKRALYLITQTGCEFCERKRIRKVYWEFGGGVRCCTDCLHARTMSDYRLENELGVSKKILDRLPHTTAEMYAPKIGSYTLRFYWTKTVLKEIGASSVEYAREICDARNKAAELAKEERRKAQEEENANTFFEAVKEAVANDRKMRRASEFAPKAFASPAALCKASHEFNSAVKSSPFDGALNHFKHYTLSKIAKGVVEKIVSANMSRWYRDSGIMYKLNSRIQIGNVYDKGTAMAVQAVFNSDTMPLINKAWFVENAEKYARELVEQITREQEMAEQAEQRRLENERRRLENIQKRRLGMVRDMERVHRCPVCHLDRDRVFTMTGLTSHMQAKHPGVAVPIP